MTHFHASQMQPSSTTVLWTGSPSDLASVATGGRIHRAAYTLTEDAVQFEAGVLTTSAQTIPLHAVVDVDLNQTITQKARGVADLTLRIDPAAAGRYGQGQLILKSIKDAKTVKDLIVRQANTVPSYWNEQAHNRQLEQQRAGAANIGGFAPSPPAAAAAPAAGEDLMAKLRELADMKAAGILSDEEFGAAKSKLLG